MHAVGESTACMELYEQLTGIRAIANGALPLSINLFNSQRLVNKLSKFRIFSLHAVNNDEFTIYKVSM
jgi:hypothetical protein